MTFTPDHPRCRPVEHGSPEYAATVALRDEILRRPLGLHLTEEQIKAEGPDHHLACFLVKLKYSVVGDPFVEVGLPHVTVRKRVEREKQPGSVPRPSVKTG